MGNLHGSEARIAAEQQVHRIFAEWIHLRDGFMPPAAQWSHVCRAGVLLGHLGYELSTDIIRRLVHAEDEAYELVARHNKLYSDAAETVRILREDLGAEIIALTTSDVRVQLREEMSPQFCYQDSNRRKLARLGAQGLFGVIPEDRVIVAEHGKSHEVTHQMVLDQFAHIAGPRIVVKVGDTPGDMELTFADHRIFVVRQFREDGSFSRPAGATHVVHQLAEIVPYLSEVLRSASVKL